MAGGVSGESVLSRAVRVFDAFHAEDTALRVSEVARRSGLHVATASRPIDRQRPRRLRSPGRR